MGKIFAIGVAALVAVTFFLGKGAAFPDYHYKMTIHAGGKEFSSVRAVEQEEVSSVLDSTGRTVKRSMHGEAVIIDHPDGHTYYALIGKPGNPDYGAERRPRWR